MFVSDGDRKRKYVYFTEELLYFRLLYIFYFYVHKVGVCHVLHPHDGSNLKFDMHVFLGCSLYFFYDYLNVRI